MPTKTVKLKWKSNVTAFVKFKIREGGKKKYKCSWAVALTGRHGDADAASVTPLIYNTMKTDQTALVNPLRENGFPENSTGDSFFDLGITNMLILRPPQRVFNTGA
jgi:hypothetical protein